MHNKRHRRWFRFGLRTVFLAMTVMCCWLGWEISVVRERRSVLKELRANPAVQITPADVWAARFPAGIPGPPVAKVSRLRTWLGDEAIQQIWYMRNVNYSPSDAELNRLAKVFPEAEFNESVPIPCHPGCFPQGTLVDTPTGPRPIHCIQPGNFITAITESGESLTAEVQSVFVTQNRLWKVDTEEGTLLTTETQPLCLTASKTVPAGKLKPADRILRRQNGVLHSVRVLEVSPTNRVERVFNLVLGDSEVFIAAGFLARSKPPATIASR